MTPSAKKCQFKFGHITFEIVESDRNGITFALLAGEAIVKSPRPMFTGHVQKGMGTELRRLAHKFDELEAKL